MTRRSMIGVALLLSLSGCGPTTSTVAPATTSTVAPATTSTVAPATTSTVVAPVAPATTSEVAPIAPRFKNAVDHCDGLPEIILVDAGEAIHMTVGGTTEFDVAPADAVCVLTNLHMPRSMRDRLMNTNSSGDLQTVHWDGIEANWLFGPDWGLDILLQPIPTP
jgi:hypothetical protein